MNANRLVSFGYKSFPGRGATLLALTLWVGTGACGSPDEAVEGIPQDASTVQDGGKLDGQSVDDTTASPDSTVAPDLVTSPDTGSADKDATTDAEQDGATMVDVPLADGGADASDAGEAIDGGIVDPDASSPVDGGSVDDGSGAPDGTVVLDGAGTPDGGDDVGPPPADALCNPCSASPQCVTIADKDAVCVDLGDAGAFCGASCSADADCATGYGCQAVVSIEGAKVKQCVRKADVGDPEDSIGTCPCSKYAIDNALATTCWSSATDKDGKLIGKCAGKRTCEQGGLSACSGPAPAPEKCNAVDDDCNGETDELTCDDGNACTADACAGSSCTNVNAAGAPCDDGDACTKPDVCKEGSCVAGDKAGCDDNNPCTTDACDAQSGECNNTKAADGQACDDGDVCTEKDGCADGACAGAALNCDDDNVCTKDSCDLQSGCTAVNDDSLICDDNDKCTDKDGCKAGVCTGSAVSCDDGNSCTADSCGVDSGCANEALTGDVCDDGALCTQGDACEKGVCAPGKDADCNDDNPCTKDACDDKTGQCVNTAAEGPCDDGNACTEADACKAGACAGTKVDCNDDNPCTDDACDDKAGCANTHNSAPCDDNDKCTDQDVCAKAACAGTPLAADVCDDANPCTKDSCNPKTGCEHTNDDGLKCDDGDQCTDGDTCAAGKCDPGASVCQCKVNADCKDDGNLCNGTSVCKANKCEVDPATIVKCDGSKDTDCQMAACAPLTGKCDMTPAKDDKPCADGSKCSLDNACKVGQCADGPKPKCDDGNACTTDLCDKASGACSTKPIAGCKPCKSGVDCDDGNPCTTDACTAGKCSAAPIVGCIVGPDLVAVSIKTGADTYTAGDAGAYVANVANEGMEASGPYAESVWLSADATLDKNDLLLKDIGRPSLLPGKSITSGSTFAIPEPTKGGTWHVLLQLDREDKVKEGKEDNNVVAYKITVKDKPKTIDLAATYLKTSAATYPAGGNMVATYWDANIGKSTAPIHAVSFYLSADTEIGAGDALLKTFNVGAIGAGGTRKSATSLALPLGTKPGVWYVGVWIDPANKVYEISDTNNMKFYKITVVAPADLTGDGLKANSISLKPGAAVTLTITEKNIGGWATGNHYDSVYLSADATITTGDTYLKNVARTSLAAGKSVSFDTAITLPTLTKPGTWYLGVILDRYNQVKEGNEKNNILWLKITVSASPDLQAVSMTANKPVYKPGETASLTFAERNLGSASSGEYTTGFYISPNSTITTKDTPLKALVRPSLTPGKYVTAKVDVDLPKVLATGTWYLGMVTDSDSKVAESNEANNTRYWKITVSEDGKAIDLQPTYFVSTKAVYYAGSTVSVNFSEINNGNVSSGSYTTSFYLSDNTAITTDDTHLASVDRIAVDPGKSAAGKASFKLPLPLKPGTWYLGVFTDSKNAVKEAAESNNTRYWKITVYGTPDLEAVAFKSTKTSYRNGERVNLSFSEKNIGTANSGNFHDGFYLSADDKYDSKDVLVRSLGRAGLKVGQQVNSTSYFDVPAGTKPGTWHLIYRVDRTEAIGELSEANNMRSYKITVTPTPDLQAVSVKTDKASYAPGQTVLIDGVEKNGGTGDAGAYVTSFYMSSNTAISAGDVHLLAQNRDGLAAGKELASQVKWTVPANFKAGTWYLAIWVDRTDKVVEISESNNIKYVKVTITGQADLQATSFTTSKKSYTTGEKVVATFYEKNVGNINLGPYLDGFYLSADATIDPTKDKLLASLSRNGLSVGQTSGGKVNLLMPADTEPGTWYVGLYVDRYDQHKEVNETNNAKSYQVTVLASPDLQALTLTPDKATYKAGQLVSLKFTEKNAGGAATGGYYDGFWLSKDTKVGAGDVYVRNIGRPSLAAGKEVAGSTSFYLSTATAPGKWNILFFVDRANQVKESDETNNIKSAEIEVTAGPELAATELSAEIVTYKPGAKLSVSYKSKNIGGLSTTWYYDSWYVSQSPTLAGNNILLLNTYRPSLAAGKEVAGTANLTLPGLLDKGTWYIGYFVDRTNRVKEADEKNNIKTLKITVE